MSIIKKYNIPRTRCNALYRSSISYPMPSRSKYKSVKFVRLQMIKIQIDGIEAYQL